jgi:nucleotide-binding universal stress UspA family protein
MACLGGFVLAHPVTGGRMTIARRRRSYESGHRPKFLVIADGSPEFGRALYFAARRAARTGAGLVILAVASTADTQEWLGVGDLMREEAEAEARQLLDEAAGKARVIAGIEPELTMRSGQKADEIIRAIEEDEDIAILMLAAGTSGEGPGPLVSSLAGKNAASFPIPVVIVPGFLEDQDIDALA